MNSSRSAATVKRASAKTFDLKAMLAIVGEARVLTSYREHQTVFSQGDSADAVFLIEHGKIKISVVSPRGKEAVIAILSDGFFFGEGCLIGQPVRMATATALAESAIVHVSKPIMIRVLQDQPEFSGMFITHLLTRNARIEEDLVDHLFNSSEKRLARVLLLLANFGKEVQPDAVIPHISQETLAEMIGTTRSRVSYFLTKFRKLGFIEYNGGMHVHNSLLNIILHD